MQKISTRWARGSEISKEQSLTIGLDLGDRSSHYCVLNAVGEVILEQQLPTTIKAMEQVFGRKVRSRIALETGLHSLWVSRQLTELGHEVIVAHARNVVDLAAAVLHAVADLLLVNIQGDVIHRFHGGASLVFLNQRGR